jgi:hypothetical protein
MNYMYTMLILYNCYTKPVRIRARIDSPHPLVCHKRQPNGAPFQIRPGKPWPHVTAGVAQ